MSPTLLDYNGVEFVSVEFSDPHREARLGEFRRIPITDEQARLSIDQLSAFYESTKADADAKQTRMAKLVGLLDRLDRLVRIIRETKHDGERENAKDLYFKVTGKAFDK